MSTQARAAQPFSPQQLGAFKRKFERLWLFSPERLWLLSIKLQRSGHWRVAFLVKQLNTRLYHNSLAAGATVSPDVSLGHYSHGIVINSGVVIAPRVQIWHDVTLHARRARRGQEDRAEVPAGEIVIEEGVVIGNRAIVISPRGRRLRIGRGARIGAGTVVTQDVPAGARVVAVAPRVLLAEGSAAEAEAVPDQTPS